MENKRVKALIERSTKHGQAGRSGKSPKGVRHSGQAVDRPPMPDPRETTKRIAYINHYGVTPEAEGLAVDRQEWTLEVGELADIIVIGYRRLPCLDRRTAKLLVDAHNAELAAERHRYTDAHEVLDKLGAPAGNSTNGHPMGATVRERIVMLFTAERQRHDTRPE